MTVGCAILAAGGSRRLGRPKQLVVFQGRTLVRHIAQVAMCSRADEVAIVLRAEATRVAAALADLPIWQLRNDGWKEGIASSIRCATHWAIDRRFDAIVLLLCDQPHLTAEHIDDLIDEHARGAAMVGSRYRGVIGVPAVFDAAVAPRLLMLHGDVGANAVLRRGEVRSIEWSAGAIDIDTPDDLASVTGASADSGDPAGINGV
jgi:CTP:molybdopterin cytidylyltransferase MocA